MKKTIMLAIAMAIVGTGAALADARSACRADAQKYCADAIGDKDKVVACLKANQSKISDACKQAVASRS